MKSSNSRTILAIGLVALTVVVPAVAWYLVGSRELERQITEQSKTAQEEAYDSAVRLARQLSDRFTAVLLAEARRPFYHYEQFFLDPQSGTRTLSPLASAQTDALIEFHFQADGETGQVTVPGTEGALTGNAALLQRELDPSVTTTLSSWRGDCEPHPEGYVGPMRWRTVYLAGKPALVAVREVCTARGPVVQGILVAGKWVDRFFKSSNAVARLRPGRADGQMQAAIALTGEPWRVMVQPSVDGDPDDDISSRLRRAFLTIYIGGVAIALVAGLGVVWLVWRSDRLARQRVQFAASAAHELRTPLAGLRIYSDMLTDGLGDPAKTKEYAQRVASEADRLARVVANVLSFTRLERGILQAKPIPGDLAGALRECVARQRLPVETMGARIEAQFPAGLPAVAFDRDATAEIVENLIDNAEKHSRHATDRRIHVTLAPAGRGVELTVADHGPGVPVEVRGRLFEPYVRGHDDDAPAGLGLGLVLVKALVEAQGAQIAYSENVGGGARFVVTFPV